MDSALKKTISEQHEMLRALMLKNERLEGELGVLKNLQRKSDAASKMFDMLVKEMGSALKLDRSIIRPIKPEAPSWA